MKTFIPFLLSLAQAHRLSVQVPYNHGPPNMTLPASDMAGKAYFDELQAIYLKNTLETLQVNGTPECNVHNVHIRKSWDDFSKSERQEYIRAVKCMAKQSTRLDASTVPGARNWIDDFAWAHISQTNYIHESALLLPWHRQFIWAWEQSLRDTCGYTKALPYWDWAKYAYNQSQSPVFGKDSFGGNGAYVKHNGTNDLLVNLPVTIYRAAGTGGGCVVDGPFSKNWTLNIGLVTPSNNSFYGSHNTLTPNNTYGQQYQPRCLKRDFLQEDSSVGLNYSNVALLMQQDSISTFHPLFENGGLHGDGHSFVGGDMSDLYASPNDPLFFLHHAQVDRLWTIWQAQDFESRGLAIDGTTTFSNIPPSANATLDFEMDMGVAAGGAVPIRDAMSATGGAYCYIYL